MRPWKKLVPPYEIEAIELAVAVGGFQPDVVGDVPVEHGGNPPEFATVYHTVIKVDVR